MKVGIVSFHDLDYGIDVANLLAEAGHSVYLYTSQQRAALALPGEVSGSRFAELGLVPGSVEVRLFKFDRMRHPRNFFIAREIHQVMLADQIEVAHLLVAQGDIRSVYLSLVLKDIPTISTLIVPQPNVGDAVPAWLVRFVYSITSARSDMVIVNGENQVDLVRQRFRLATERVAYVPLGMREAHVWSRQTQDEVPDTILFFGRAAVHKGLEYLVRAQPMITARVPSARIVISAYGEDLERCKSLITDPGKFELHEGFIPGDEMPAYFQRASIVALPYLTASTSGILMTALAYGKPVVVTDVGCLPEYVQDGITGFIVPAKDEKRLAEAIIRLLEDDDLRQKMGAAAYGWVREQRKLILNLYEKYYQKAIDLHQRKTANKNTKR